MRKLLKKLWLIQSDIKWVLTSKTERVSLEDYFYRKDVVDTSIGAIEFLHPEFPEGLSEKMYYRTILMMCRERELVEFRDTLLKQTDKKAEEVQSFYNMIGEN